MPPSPKPEFAQRRKAERTKRDKTAVIYADQQTALDGLARELQDSRGVQSERITANTLIRVALDGVIAYSDRLHGDNEDELRGSWLEFLASRAMTRSADQTAGDDGQALDGA